MNWISSEEEEPSLSRIHKKNRHRVRFFLCPRDRPEIPMMANPVRLQGFTCSASSSGSRGCPQPTMPAALTRFISHRTRSFFPGRQASHVIVSVHTVERLSVVLSCMSHHACSAETQKTCRSLIDLTGFCLSSCLLYRDYFFTPAASRALS